MRASPSGPWTSLALAFVAACTDPALPPPTTDAWRAAFDARTTGWLMNAWGSAPDDLYAVGGRPDAGVVMHYDGRAWSRVTLGVDVPLVNWAYGFGRGDVTLVGSGGTVIHWDGRTWTRQPTPTTRNLWGVWGAAPDNLWAVGGDGADEHPVLLHYDGRAWTEALIPKLMRAGVSAFFKVWGTGADNVYVVGQRGAVLHYTNGAWREELVGVSDDLVSLWGTDASHILAVGGRGNGVVVRWDGQRWTARSLSPIAGLNGVWMRTPDAAHVVGVYGTALRIDLATLTPREETTPTELDLHSVFGDSSGRLLAVGGRLGSLAGPFDGVAVTRALAPTE